MRIWAWNCVQAHCRCAQADARQWSYGYGYGSGSGYYGYKRRNWLATSLAVSLPMRARSRPRAPWRVEWPLPRCGVRCAARWAQRVEVAESKRVSGQQRSWGCLPWHTGTSIEWEHSTSTTIYILTTLLPWEKWIDAMENRNGNGNGKTKHNKKTIYKT